MFWTFRTITTVILNACTLPSNVWFEHSWQVKRWPWRRVTFLLDSELPLHLHDSVETYIDRGIFHSVCFIVFMDLLVLSVSGTVLSNWQSVDPCLTADYVSSSALVERLILQSRDWNFLNVWFPWGSIYYIITWTKWWRASLQGIGLLPESLNE